MKSVESNKLAVVLDRLKDSPCYGVEGSVSRRCEDLVDDLWSLYSGQTPYHVLLDDICTGDEVEQRLWNRLVKLSGSLPPEIRDLIRSTCPVDFNIDSAGLESGDAIHRVIADTFGDISDDELVDRLTALQAAVKDG